MPRFERVEGRLLLATFVVDTTSDLGPGSLRQAILDSNNDPGTIARPNVIDFDIGAGVQAIEPTSALPAITAPVSIDATPASLGGRPGIEIRGNMAGPGAAGLAIEPGGSGSSVSGLSIGLFDGAGILLVGGGDDRISANFIGIDANGSLALPNGGGVVMLEGSSGNTIGGSGPVQGNLISGNRGDGITVSGQANVVRGNRVGLDDSGAEAVGNGGDGVLVEGTGNTIGGVAPSGTNFISGNARNGVEVFQASGNVISGNLIGTDVTGSKAVANDRDGVLLNGASGNTVGGTAAGMLNVISGNMFDGVGIIGAGANFNVVLGDIIGTDLDYLATDFTFTGADSLVNRGDGVRIDGGSGDVSFNTIGGCSAGSGNVIAGNLGNGVEVDNQGATDESVVGNLIGNVSGVDPISGSPLRQPNYLNGVAIVNASSNTIGGTTPAARNVISGNIGDGVEILGGNNNTVEGDYIGSDPEGITDRGNLGDGVGIHSGTLNMVGGTASGAGNLILGNSGSGISINQSLLNIVLGNQIGLNVLGSPFSGTLNADGSPHELGNNQDGIQLNNASVGNMIGEAGPGARNVISGNLKNGISVINASLANAIQGNFVGLDASGSVGEGNGLNGIYVTTSYNTVGGTTSGAGNVVSGNLNSGVVLSTGSAVDDLVVGNLIGTDASGGTDVGAGDPADGADGLPIGNRQDGVFVNDDAVSNTIGGTAASARNVVSGNGSDGVQVLGINVTADPTQPLPPGDLVEGDFIGVTASGEAPDGNAAVGVFLYNARGNVVGQAGGGRNVISGNLGPGVAIQGEASTNNVIEGNSIGADSAGSAMLGNRGDGVTMVEAEGNQIGDLGAGNVIFDNAGSGVSMTAGSSFNVVAGDVISANAGDGVLLSNGSTDDLVAGDEIGVDASGEAAEGNRLDGVRVDTAGPGNQVISDLISANTGSGVLVTGTGSGASILGNTIGLDASGESGMGNAVGVEVDGVAGITVGGPGAGNTISGNEVGVLITPEADTSVPLGDSVEGNVIGLDAHGTKSIGNTFGVFLNDAVGVTVGGTSPGSGNTISGNSGVGIQAFRVSSGGPGNTIEGNLIGLDSSGTAAPTGGDQPIGVFLNSASNNTVGGTIPAARNVISGNVSADSNIPSFGVSIYGQSNARPLDNVVEGMLSSPVNVTFLAPLFVTPICLMAVPPSKIARDHDCYQSKGVLLSGERYYALASRRRAGDDAVSLVIVLPTEAACQERP